MTRSPRSACSQLLLSLLLLSAGGSRAVAQVHADTAQVLVELITVEDGLPQGMVQCMLQDRTGYLWFGTRGGLARSDGYGFTIYQHDDQDSTSIASNIVREMIEDRHGRLWLGFESGAVDLFDPRTGAFTHVVTEPGPSVGLWPDIMKLSEDRDGNIWFNSMQGGLHVVRGSSAGERPVEEGPRDAFPLIPWPEDIRAFDVAGNGELWIAFGDSLMVLDAHVQRCLTRVRAGYATDELRILSPLHRMTADGAGSGMWLIRDAELYHFTRTDGGIHCIPVPLGETDHTLNRVKEVDGRLWVGGNLYERIVTANGRIEPIRFTEIHGKRLKPELGMICWAQDRSGTIWAGTNGYGVLKITRMRQRFHQLPNVATIYRASSSGALALVKANEDHWTDASGRTTTANVHKSLVARGLMVNPNVWVIDPRARVWISSAPQWGIKPRLTVIERSGELRFPDIVPDTLATRSIFPGQGDEIWALAVKGPKVWNASASLLRIDTRQERLLRQYPIPFFGRDWSDVASVEMGGDGSVWLVTKNGLFHLEPNTGAWERIHHNDADPRSIPSDHLIGICFDPQDPEHLLWIGSGGGGLVKYDRRSGVVEHYTTKQGLPSNVVYGILADERDNLWFGTDMGLCRFDPRTKELKRYTYEDGLLGNEFNTRAAGQTRDGRMFFGGPMGTTWFRPAEFYGSEPSSPTVITGLRLTDQEVTAGSFMLPGSDVPLLDRAMDHTASITLPFDERMITFTYACLDHTLPGTNSFRYQLEGFSPKWINAGARHEATFTHLDAGTYTFRVQGCNSNGVWDQRGASVQLIITPPWWGTWWFRISAVLAFAGVLYAFYRYRLAQAVKVVRVRERIARDLHDEIGSTLSSVSLFSSVAQKKAAGKAPEASELLGRITDSTTQVLEAMNDIVWAVNADNDDMASVIKRMHAFAVNVTEARGCELHLRADEELKHERLEMTQRKNLYLIFKEAVNNAVKYSGGANLRVELVRDKSAVVLRVADDGKGFEPSMLNESAGGGNGLGNMRNRAAEIPGTLTIFSEAGKGTTVELRFVPGEGRRSLEPMTPVGGKSR